MLTCGEPSGPRDGLDGRERRQDAGFLSVLLAVGAGVTAGQIVLLAVAAHVAPTALHRAHVARVDMLDVLRLSRVSVWVQCHLM